jgi:hypothetical protein
MQMHKPTFRARTGRLARIVSSGATGAAMIVTVGVAAPAAGAPARTGAVTNLVGGLNAVSADSPTDAWAVGEGSTVLHWNGTAWAKVKIPGVTGIGLSSVDALSPDNVWAVGVTPGTAFATARTLIVHWNGTAWTKKLGSQIYNTRNVIPSLSSVSMDSATDGWAVGGVFTKVSDPVQPLAWHFNGTAWRQVKVGPGINFSAVTSFSPANAVAVGRDTTGSVVGVPAAFHWNGSTWALATDLPVPPGATAAQTGGPSSMSADSPTDIWAPGGRSTSTNAVDNLAWHWDGTSWSVMDTGLVTPDCSGTFGTAAISPSNVWVVGFSDSNCNNQATWAAHWTGTGWAQVPTPNPNVEDVLQGVGADGPSDVWAVGISRIRRNGVHHTLILHWNGTSWVQA